ncbi:hypothetical protein FF1_034991 [Malus domestica]
MRSSSNRSWTRSLWPTPSSAVPGATERAGSSASACAGLMVMSGAGAVSARVVHFVAAVVGQVRVGHFRFRSPYSAPTLRLSRMLVCRTFTPF